MKIHVTRLNKEIPLPKYAHEGDAGMDVFNSGDEVEIAAGEHKLIPTGIKVSIPVGYEIQVRPRSGLALKKGLTVLNTPGTIDSGYRGEIGVILMNHSGETAQIEKEMRVAQIVLNQVENIEWEEVDELDDSRRGAGGYGSTGVKK